MWQCEQHAFKEWPASQTRAKNIHVQSPPLSKVIPHGSTHMYYTPDLIEHPNLEANSAKRNCNYIRVVLGMHL